VELLGVIIGGGSREQRLIGGVFADGFGGHGVPREVGWGEVAGLRGILSSHDDRRRMMGVLVRRESS
jgi:hypothetical protein